MKAPYSSFAAIVGVLTLTATPLFAEGKPVERRGVTVASPDSDSILNPKTLTNEIKKLPPMKIVKVNSIERPAKVFDAEHFQADTRALGDVCFTSVGPMIPWGSFRESDAEPMVRTMTCEKRDDIVKKLGFTAVFLQGTGYVCSFIPVPQVQFAGKVIDVASYATSTIALVISTQECVNTMEAKFNAAIKVCDELKTMGVNCLGVENEPF